MADAEPIDPRDIILACTGHAMVLGGPGSGKTTLALKKALKRIREGLVPGQSILFLSFSRAAVARLLDAANLVVPKADLAALSVQTFHSFFWNQLKVHGYLLGAPKRLSILLPQDEKAINGGIDKDNADWAAWTQERERLFREEGRVAFDLFAPNTATLLTASSNVLAQVAMTYPLVIVDEAQDTGDDAWSCIELLAAHTQVVCLADLEQQIFDFLPGVGPERIHRIRHALQPLEADLGNDNHRSPGTEILALGNDLLAAMVKPGAYAGIASILYGVGKQAPNWNLLLRRALSNLFRDMRGDGKGSVSTVAILTMGKSGALKMSNALNGMGANPGKVVRHKLLFDEAEALLTARLAAFLLEPKQEDEEALDIATCMELVAAARRSTGGAKAVVDKLQQQSAKIRAGKTVNIKLVAALRSILRQLRSDGFTGDPAADWLQVKRHLRASGREELIRCASQLDYLVAFKRGQRISAALSDEWLRDGVYTRARVALDAALAQEQLLDGIAEPPGIQVMNVHKAKGKQFDGVIFVREIRQAENGPTSSFLWRGDAAPYVQSRRLVRVGITRARRRLLILTPTWPVCPLHRWERL
ncbi:UvrD-helicase domain-containing protein [Pseudoduganella sp. R-34]|uniref:UvrD-helicase domain-containing protein n=1 Tax=Pseudoduganella sp. R-34 TaxID=3404062 RepID=UPI003CFBC07D